MFQLENQILKSTKYFISAQTKQFIQLMSWNLAGTQQINKPSIFTQFPDSKWNRLQTTVRM